MASIVVVLEYVQWIVSAFCEVLGLGHGYPWHQKQPVPCDESDIILTAWRIKCVMIVWKTTRHGYE